MQTKVSLKQTEMSLIQSLISPHFLFNCLSTITSLAFLEEAEKTEECSILLSEYLRTFLDHIGKVVTVWEEVCHTQDYLNIQRMRFGGRIRFVIRCQEECRTIRIPALILQPIIENSISHGLKNRQGQGEVKISLWKERETLFLEVKDNGGGMTQEQIDRLKCDLEQPFTAGGHGIGLHSVVYRMKDFFSGCVRVFLTPGEPGLCVQIAADLQEQSTDRDG